MLSSYDIRDVYDSLGMSPAGLGCIMLDADPVPQAAEIPEQDLYYSKNPEQSYIRGAVSLSESHVTLLYGLLESGPTWRKLVDRVLEGWEIPRALVIDEVTSFGPVPGEHYSCIVAKIGVTENLAEGHSRLQLLPHIDTFPYKPHLTLAYVHENVGEKWEAFFKESLLHTEVAVHGLNYGD